VIVFENRSTFAEVVINSQVYCFLRDTVYQYTRDQVCYARVLDFRRKFIEAAQRYNELSYKSIIAESERMTALKNALICTILASAGN